jgi:hypothetical protein
MNYSRYTFISLFIFAKISCNQPKQDNKLTNGKNFIFQYGGKNNDEGLSIFVDKYG